MFLRTTFELRRTESRHRDWTSSIGIQPGTITELDFRTLRSASPAWSPRLPPWSTEKLMLWRVPPSQAGSQWQHYWSLEIGTRNARLLEEAEEAPRSYLAYASSVKISSFNTSYVPTAGSRRKIRFASSKREVTLWHTTKRTRLGASLELIAAIMLLHYPDLHCLPLRKAIRYQHRSREDECSWWWCLIVPREQHLLANNQRDFK